ncbi:hypothetical protein [Massilia sp. SYSU DXS3249]
MPRSVVLVLLSLFLLFSQQVSALHGLSHVEEARMAAQEGTGAGGKSSKAALHDLCAGCAASAQLAFALPATASRFVPLAPGATANPASTTPDPCRPAACAFQPRGPPRA